MTNLDRIIKENREELKTEGVGFKVLKGGKEEDTDNGQN